MGPSPHSNVCDCRSILATGTVSKIQNTNKPRGAGEEQDSKLGNSLTLAFLISKRVIGHDLIQLEVVRMTMYEENGMDFCITTLG